MHTVDAIYDNGKLILFEKIKIKKAKVKITFLEEIVNKKIKLQFPTQNLGEIYNLDRNDLYDEYLSARH
jgi:predicted DNA-binding antitoxin AbrB/MazE fold protein